MLRATHLSLLVAQDAQEMAVLAAELLEEQAAAALRRGPLFTLAVSGGRTPIELFRLLASPKWRERVNWERTALYWVDERCSGPEQAGSHYGLARAELISRVPLTRFYRMKGEDEPVRAAQAYENLLREHFNLAEGEFPRFDCVLLGVGADGRTGSLYPGAEALREQTRLVTDHYLRESKASRLTLTLPVLNNARCCIFLAGGREKKHVLSTALNLMAEPCLPAQMVRPTGGKLCWIIDEAAYTGE